MADDTPDLRTHGWRKRLAASPQGNETFTNEDEPNQIFEYRSNTDILRPEMDVIWQSPDSSATTSLAWGDWDLDGDLELLVSNMNQPNQLYSIRKEYSSVVELLPISGTVAITATLTTTDATVVNLLWESVDEAPTADVDWIQ